MGIDDVVGVMPVLERHRFEVAGLERYMAACGGPLEQGRAPLRGGLEESPTTPRA